MALSPVRRRWLLVETVVFALPTTLLYLGFLAVALFSIVVTLGRGPHLLAVLLAPLICLSGFWRIALAALRGHDLRAVDMPWWVAMKSGMLLSITPCILWIFIALEGEQGSTPDGFLALLLAGPALLVPATHLLFERRAA